MSAKKILSYSRFVLVTLLVVYLLLVWMYFKDNTRELTSSGLLLWFVAVPLLIVGVIMTLLWWQKRLANKAKQAIEDTGAEEDKKAPVKLLDSYQLFIYSRVCLPEGDNWSEVIDNDEDLTVLSEDLMDMDGLPILTKPITRLADAASLSYAYLYNNTSAASYVDEDDDSDEDDTHTERLAALSGSTLRLCSLIHEQLESNDEILSLLAEHFDQRYREDNTQSNSAIDVHPEWQQHYLASANSDNAAYEAQGQSSHEERISNVTLTNLPIYLCVPASADSAMLSAAIIEQLATYGIAEALLSIEVVTTHDIDLDVEDSQELDDSYFPSEFIQQKLMSLSQSTVPELCLLLIADSQIDEEWLDTHLYSNRAAELIPTEAGTLLLFFNKAAQEVLDIESSVSVLLTEICTPSAQSNDIKNPTMNADETDHAERLSNKRSYVHHLKTIQNLLIDNNFSLSPTGTDTLTAVNKPLIKPTKKLSEKPSDSADNKNNKTNVSLSDMSIVAISDINPLKQPYDMTVYMSFIDAFIAKGALVNEHHLGHYMPLNNWLTPFISLSLFVDMAQKDQQESEKIFLVTQHKHCSVLWLADASSPSAS